MNSDLKNRASTTSTSRATEHNTDQQHHYAEQANSTPRSIASHPCITIRGSVPASGRPVNPRAAVDLECADFMIVPGWSRC